MVKLQHVWMLMGLIIEKKFNNRDEGDKIQINITDRAQVSVKWRETDTRREVGRLAFVSKKSISSKVTGKENTAQEAERLILY